MAGNKKGHGGKRKVGKNADKCKRYRSEGRREKNKARRQAKRERRFAKKRAEKGSHFFKK